MKRRAFIQKLLTGMGYALAANLLPRPLLAAINEQKEVDALHYHPLNGKSLRDLADRKIHHGQDQFINPVGIGRSGRLWQVLNWKLFHKNRFQKDFRNEQVVPVKLDWDAIRQHSGLSLTYLKHASVLIKDHNRYLLIDPVFNDIFWFIKDFSPMQTEGMPAIDDVLITHGHYDHLDTASLASMPAGTHVISPLGYDAEFEALKMTNRTRLDWYDSVTAGGVEITLLPCNHWTMRNPLIGPNRSLWGSYLIRTAGGMTIYVSGDTAYFDGFSQIGAEFDIDLAVFNLGAYEPRWFMAPSHANPAETVRAFRELKAGKLMIVHWGTFRLGDEPVHFPPLDIRAEMQKAGLQDRLISVNHGQTLFL
jgi:L-ascorbate metabolism protein UlaG (beta-lactamase superfamily)